MVNYKTPGVYVEEIATLPPSVADVSTAIPAFIGHTAKRPTADDKDTPTVVRITSFLEYESLFGPAQPARFQVTTEKEAETQQDRLVSVQVSDPPKHFMDYALRLYFKNGGGACYVISVGTHDEALEKARFEAGLAALEKEDEPTLILLGDAVNLDAVAYHDLCVQALSQCAKLGDRFAIFDIRKDDGKGEAFRDGIGMNNLKYGAAYFPWLQTSLTYAYDENQVKLASSSESQTGEAEEEATTNEETGDAGENTESGNGNSPTVFRGTFGVAGIAVSYSGNSEDAPKVTFTAGTDALSFSVNQQQLSIANIEGKTGAQIVDGWGTWKTDNESGTFDIVVDGDGSGQVPAGNDLALTAEPNTSDTPDQNPPSDEPSTSQNEGQGNTLASLRSDQTALYNQIKAALARQYVVLPPSAAVAGIYASVDRDRGVWKAPANVSVQSIIGPTVKVSHQAQELLNIDPTGGKSINAIRAFAGKGTLVWGARTLAGNDNEWRYISVRRLFNMIEESTRKATAFAVFEPNDATTWLKVKAMIDSYLYGLWQQGGLAGPSPEAAYFVNVGLGKTMTNQDILEGRMNVEIGIAAVRPAEFIILKFSHKLQEA